MFAYVLLGILLGLILFLVIFGVSIYNSLVRQRNDIDNAFAQINVQLTRRYELIPNLVEVAKKYLQHEKETLIKVIAARNNAAEALQNINHDHPSPSQIAQLGKADAGLSSMLGGLYATFEDYPDLKADQQMSELREEISSTENRVAFARQHFNDSVTVYNNTVEQFPNNLVSSAFKFSTQQWLELDEMEEKRKPLKVSFE